MLAIQFKYLGDAVILTPALKALATQVKNIELHVLVAAEVAPLLEGLPWIAKVWAMPRQRGKVKLWQSIPFIYALRCERFDQSVDFGGNDRGALLSYLSGAKNRLGSSDHDDSKLLRKICYTQMVRRLDPGAPYFDLHFELLKAWNIKRPEYLNIEIVSSGVDRLSNTLPKDSILCHISTSQSKKDWPLRHWQSFYHLASDAGLILVFSAGPNQREQNLLKDLKSRLPQVRTLPPIEDLQSFLSVLKCARIFVSGDTGPLHFAEGLNVPVLGIFGVDNSIKQVAPIYRQENLICANECDCHFLVNHTATCQSSSSCMSSIQPEAVFQKLNIILKSLA